MGPRPARLGRPLRAVFDTGVVVSALVFEGGRLSWLRSAWQSGAVRPLASAATVSELLRVLAYPKFNLSAVEQQALLSDYLPWCEAIAVKGRMAGVPRCRDPFDQPFLLLALAAKADVLVSGDDDLLAVAPRFSIPVIRPADLAALLDAGPPVPTDI